MKQGHAEIQFLSNEILSTDIPIRFDVARDFNFRIFDLKFSKMIDCDKAEELRHNGFLQQYAETIYFRFGESKDSDGGYSSLSTVLSNKCANATYLITVISVVIVSILIFAIIAAAVLYRCWNKRQPERQRNMIISDGKTYCETQIMIQIENAGLLKTNL